MEKLKPTDKNIEKHWSHLAVIDWFQGAGCCKRANGLTLVTVSIYSQSATGGQVCTSAMFNILYYIRL
jgi:hypothetical protein